MKSRERGWATAIQRTRHVVSAAGMRTRRAYSATALGISFLWQFRDLYWWRWSSRRSLRRIALTGLQEYPRPFAFPWARVSSWPVGFGLVVALTTAASWVLGDIAPVVGDPQLSMWLKALWPVEGAVLGFTFALAIYAYDYLGRRSTIARDIALAASFPAAVNLGIALLVLTGICVLAPFGAAHQAWLDRLTTGIAVGWTGSIVAATAEAIELNDPRYRVRMRQRVLMPLVAAARRERHAGIRGMEILRRFLLEAGGRYEALGVSVAGVPEDSVVRARRRGRVADVNVRRLAWATAVAARRQTELRTGVHIGLRVASETPVAYSDNGIMPGLARFAFKRSIEIRAARSGASTQIELLASEAQAAIDTDRLILEAVLEAFEDAVRADLGS